MMEENFMTFCVEIILIKQKTEREIRAFYKNIEAANAEQSCKFAKQMLNGFLANGISVETTVINAEWKENQN